MVVLHTLPRSRRTQIMLAMLFLGLMVTGLKYGPLNLMLWHILPGHGDKILHVLGGLGITALLIAIFQKNERPRGLLVLAGLFALQLGWEGYEVALGSSNINLTSGLPESLRDTVVTISAGALLLGASYRWSRRRPVPELNQ